MSSLVVELLYEERNY